MSDREADFRLSHLILDRRAVRDSVTACTSCALHTVGSGPIPFSGPASPFTLPRIVVVGEAPGKQEDTEHAPFVGPSGRLIRHELGEAGLDVAEVAWVNTVSCFPNRTPSGAEVRACRDNLVRQVSFLQPEFVLLVGGVAVSAWWGGVRIGEIRGHWIRLPVAEGYTPWAFATWHPSAVLRNNELSAEWREDLAMFRVGCDTAPHVNWYCVKCNRETNIRVGPSGDRESFGVPYCPRHYAVLRGMAGKGRSEHARTKNSPKSPSRSSRAKGQSAGRGGPRVRETGLFD